MKWFTDMQVEMRIIAAFIMAAAAAGIIGYIGIRDMYKANLKTGRMHEREFLGRAYVREARIRLMSTERAERNAILASTRQSRQKYVNQARISEVLGLKFLQKARPMFTTAEGQELLDNVDRLWNEYVAVHDQVLDLVMKENPAEVRKSSELSMGAAWPRLDALETALNTLEKAGEDEAEERAAKTARLLESSRARMLTLSIACILFGIGLGAILALSITRPVNRLKRGLTDGAARTPSASGQTAGTGGTRTENPPMDCLADSRQDISESGMETLGIVKAIDGIALHANLLALNAAVESARAGKDRTGITSISGAAIRAQTNRKESFMGHLTAGLEAKIPKQHDKPEADGDD